MTLRALAFVALVCLLAGSLPAVEAPVDFDREIRPILSNNCFACHGPDQGSRKAGLRLDTREGAMADLGGYSALVPGDLEKSELWARITEPDPDVVMPPAKTGKKLTDREKTLIRRWIEQDAPYPRHWSFVTPVQPDPPSVGDENWVRNPIDRFVLARLQKEGLRPSPEAPKLALIRRVTQDLTGLPPTPAEVDAFLADDSPNAYEKLVDRLLASPRYGERMAMEWLDAARYADTHGFHIDSGRDMTRWREWVIDAFNANMPFDRFTIEQLAGDMLPNATLEQKIASGFNRNHMINFEGGAIPEEYHAAYVMDRVNTTSTVWLGLTVACAQCHDHKYDPITQKDYYRLYAFFNNVPENGLDGQKGNAMPYIPTPTPQQEQAMREHARLVTAAEAELDEPDGEVDVMQMYWEIGPRDGSVKLPEPIERILGTPADQRSDRQRHELRHYYRRHVSPPLRQKQERLATVTRQRDQFNARIRTTMVMAEMDKPRDTFILLRGQYDKKGEKVTPGIPEALGQLPSDAPANRLTLAKWLTDPSHPLTARVTVNRYWQLFFGTGLVKTAEDFGTQGERPSHPELLDWLATRFVAGRWDVKALHRLIVTSATYRQASLLNKELRERDPENRLLARGARFRLHAEFIRDQALFASGLLNGEIGGHSVFPYQPPGLWEELMSREDGDNWTAQKYTPSHGADLYRRSMYTFWKRTSPPAQLATFDAPDREVCAVRRARTNTPLQALILMNDPTYVEAARKLAERMMTEAGSSADDRIRFAVQWVLSRPARADEIDVLRAVYQKQLIKFRNDTPAARRLLAVGESPANEKLDAAELAAWAIVASTVLNLDEAVTRS